MKKTIFMSREKGEKWLAALRSGEYKQGVGVLCNKEKYCCLGVLQKVVSGEVENLSVPSLSWLEKNNVIFRVNGKLDLRGNPSLAFSSAAELNDDGVSFFNLADLIEVAMEYTDENV